MPVWRILYYLLEFYLFAASGALAYLSLRAWLVPAVSARRKSGNQPPPRAWHFVRGVAFVVIALAALIGAINEGAPDLHVELLSGLRLAGYAVVFVFLTPSLRMRRKVWLTYFLLVLGEILLVLYGHLDHSAATALFGPSTPSVLPYAGLICLDIGMALLGSVITRSLVRVRLLDRLVIAFAVFSLLLAQIVALSLLGIIVSMGFDLSGSNAVIAADLDKPLAIILTVVLITSALVGYFLARDLSAPVTRLARALRAIGEGDLDSRVQLGGGTEEDEMHDLAREVNRMAQRLKSADALRAEFISFVSHELRSPLTSIQGFADTLLADPELSEKQRTEFYGIIHDESDRLLRLINELLDISRLQAGKELSLAIERFDAARHVQKVAQIMRSHTTSHTLSVSGASRHVAVEADPDKFDQVLINLLSNAIKYSPEGGAIQVSLEEDGQDVTISVKDNGIGMTSEQVAHVFDKFYRASDSTNPPGEEGEVGQASLMRIQGSGLGLYLTRALVEAHGGDIRVESKPGSGSTFTVRFPRRNSQYDTRPKIGLREEAEAVR
jgi:signal transduction histidine kinase